MLALTGGLDFLAYLYLWINPAGNILKLCLQLLTPQMLLHPLGPSPTILALNFYKLAVLIIQFTPDQQKLTPQQRTSPSAYQTPEVLR